MLGDDRVVVTEWMWLGIKLEMVRLETQSTVLAHSFDLANQGRIVCRITSSLVGDFRGQGLSQDEQRDLFEGWRDAAHQRISQVLEDLPGIRAGIDIRRDVEVWILEPAGMSPRVICRFHGGEVTWA